MESVAAQARHGVEFMHIRSKIGSARRQYLWLSACACLGTYMFYLLWRDTGVIRFEGVLVAGMAPLFGVAYWRAYGEPRFWTLAPALSFTLFVASALVARLIEGNLNSLRDAWGLLLVFGFLLNIWDAVPKRETAAFIEENRVAWDAYIAGKSFWRD